MSFPWWMWFEQAIRLLNYFQIINLIQDNGARDDRIRNGLIQSDGILKK
jgi:hypothetical protein